MRLKGGRAAALAFFLGAAACAEVPPSAPHAPAPERPALPGTLPPAPPATLVGWNAREVVQRLGEPALRRRDPPAEIWQYRRGSCVVDLFLYAESGRETPYTVRHVEARVREAAHGEVRPRGQDAPRAECLDNLMKGAS